MALVYECQAILFDMDGTLVDSTKIVERQWQRFANLHGLDYARIMQISHGRRNEETIREIAPHLATPEIFARFDSDELEDRYGAVAVEGASTLLAQLKPTEWAVVTSAHRALARTRLQSVNLPLPQVLIGADDVSHGKPHPEGYLTAAQHLAADPHACIVFEDTPPGLEAAQAAGIRAIAISTTYPCGHLGAFDCITDFTCIQLERLANGTLRLAISSSQL